VNTSSSLDNTRTSCNTLKDLTKVGVKKQTLATYTSPVTGVDPITLDTGTELVAAALKPRRGVEGSL
jgi:hypothetical protein